MRPSTLLAAAALLWLMPGSARAAATLLSLVPGSTRAEPTRQAPVLLAQTGGAGSNSPAGVSGPKSDVAPGSTDGTIGAGKRTSKDNGTDNPLSGDQMDDRRPNADPRLGGTMPRPSPGGSAR